MTAAAAARWIAQYPEGLPADIVPAYGDALAMFRGTLASFPQGVAIAYFDGAISYAALDAMSDAFAGWLADRRLGKGDRVAIVLQNVPHAAIAILAAWKIGAIPVPLNPMYRAAELAKLFADFTPSAIIGHDDHLEHIIDAQARTGQAGVPLVAVSARDFQTRNDPRLLPAAPDTTAGGAIDLAAILASHEIRTPPSTPLQGTDLAMILYTSGTTGVPKGAMISHASVVFNATVSARWMAVASHSRILGLAPIFHITGFILHLALAWATGATVGLHYRVHPEAVIELIRAWRPTFGMAAITAFNALMNVPGVTPADFASFETVFSGGAPIAPALREEMRQRLGITVLPAYGMTETCSPTHLAPPGLDVPVCPETGALSVGLPMSSTQAKIVGPDGQDLPPGHHGEVCMRGPQVMAGYWNKPDETDACLLDGWMHSGDIGFQDENGWFFIVDRSKDMINASGFKVWPREVEDVLHAHPTIREAAVVGVPDAYRGETVHAYVALKAHDLADTAAPSDAASLEADLMAHCRARLAAYKVPRRIVVLDELPKTLSGKIQRAALRQPDACQPDDAAPPRA